MSHNITIVTVLLFSFKKQKNRNYSTFLTGIGKYSKGMFLICKCDMYIYGII